MDRGSLQHVLAGPQEHHSLVDERQYDVDVVVVVVVVVVVNLYLNSVTNLQLY